MRKLSAKWTCTHEEFAWPVELPAVQALRTTRVAGSAKSAPDKRESVKKDTPAEWKYTDQVVKGLLGCRQCGRSGQLGLPAVPRGAPDNNVTVVLPAMRKRSGQY